LCLAGTMVWAVDQDDTNGDSMNNLLGIGTANGVSPDQAQSFKDQLNNATLQQEIAASCYWSFCGDQCQSGYFGVTEAKGQVAGVQRNSVCSGDDVQTLCCAPGTTLGTCQWEGWRGVGLPCAPVCNDTSADIIARNTNSYTQSSNDQLNDRTCTGTCP
jgi:chitinase